MGKLTAIGSRIGVVSTRCISLPTKTVDPFYLSPEWRGLCAEIKRERWPVLRERQGHCCEDPECRVQHTGRERIYFDHVLELRDRPDLALVKSNIMGRCGSSHTRKTGQARAARLGAPG